MAFERRVSFEPTHAPPFIENGWIEREDEKTIAFGFTNRFGDYCFVRMSCAEFQRLSTFLLGDQDDH